VALPLAAEVDEFTVGGGGGYGGPALDDLPPFLAAGASVPSLVLVPRRLALFSCMIYALVRALSPRICCSCRVVDPSAVAAVAEVSANGVMGGAAAVDVEGTGSASSGERSSMESSCCSSERLLYEQK